MMRSSASRRDREHLAAIRGELATDGTDGAARSADTESIIDRLDRSASVSAVLDALGGLSVRHQEVIALRYLADFSPGETAAALGVSRGNVAVLLHRAVRALRTELRTELEETS